VGHSSLLLGLADGCGLLNGGLFLLCELVMGSGELLLEGPVLLDNLCMGLMVVAAATMTTTIRTAATG
jgi:hypothetical protein